VKKPNPHFSFSILSAGLLCLSIAVLVGSCSSKDSYSVWSESLMGLIGGAVMTTQPPSVRRTDLQIRAFDGLPSSSVSCPTITNADDSLASCLDFQNSQIDPNTAGKYLRRYLGLCQTSGLKSAPWWRSYQVFKFPSQAICQAINASSDGLSSANISATSLVGETVTITFGLGPNSDEQNIVFSQDGDVQYLWSDFQTGWLESKQGGIDVTFTTTNERNLMIQGLQVKTYSPVNQEINSPIDLYVDIQNKPSSQVLTLKSDHTFASIKNGDRKFERKEADLDFTYGQDYPLQVAYSGSVPVVKAGGKIRTQYNSNQALAVTTISEDLRFTDPNCCWPTTGKITTEFNDLYALPLVSKKSFTQETMQFTTTCGRVTLVQLGAGAGEAGTSRTIQLHQCFY
jgi:hypothetical protein